MITVKQAYVLGYLPQMIGFHFNGLEILSRIPVESQGAIKDRIAPLLESWPLRGPETVHQIRRVEATLQLLGVSPGNPPKFLEEYFLWAESITQQVEQLLSVKKTSIEVSMEQQLILFRSKWAHTFATKLGDLLHTMNLGALVNYLLGAKVPNQFLSMQRERLDKMAKEILGQLKQIEERTAFLGTFPEPTQQIVNHVVQVLSSAPAIAKEEDPDVLAAILQKTIADTVALDIEKQFDF